MCRGQQFGNKWEIQNHVLRKYGTVTHGNTIVYGQERLRIVRYLKSGQTLHNNGKPFTLYIENTVRGPYSEHKQVIIGKRDETFY
jgi:hypothetical protein